MMVGEGQGPPPQLGLSGGEGKKASVVEAARLLGMTLCNSSFQ